MRSVPRTLPRNHDFAHRRDQDRIAHCAAARAAVDDLASIRSSTGSAYNNARHTDKVIYMTRLRLNEFARSTLISRIEMGVCVLEKRSWTVSSSTSNLKSLMIRLTASSN